jgi:hypothetical protein
MKKRRYLGDQISTNEWVNRYTHSLDAKWVSVIGKVDDMLDGSFKILADGVQVYPEIEEEFDI